MHRLALLLVVALTLAGCEPSQQQIAAAIAQTQAAATATAAAESCKPADLQGYGAAMVEQVTLYANQSDLVGSTPRMGMSVPLQRLLDIQMAASKLEPPACVAEVHQHVLSAMQEIQGAYQRFMGQQGTDTENGVQLNAAHEELLSATKDLLLIKGGAVPPTPTPTPPPTPAPTVTPIATPRLVDPPRPMTIAMNRDLYASPTVRGKGTWVCKGAAVEVIAEQKVEGRLWYQIRIVTTPECGNGATAGPNKWWVLN